MPEVDVQHWISQSMANILTVAMLKRRGMAAIEEGLRHGPIHIAKRNKPATVVLSEDEYSRLIGNQPEQPPGQTALKWLLSDPFGPRGSCPRDRRLSQRLAAELEDNAPQRPALAVCK